MIQVANQATSKLVALLTAPDGINAGLPTPIEATQVAAQNVAAEIAERNVDVKYPAIYVYCERVSNQLRENSGPFRAGRRWRSRYAIRRTGCKGWIKRCRRT